MAEDFTASNELLDKFANFQRAKRRETIQRIAQVVGAGAETMRTGRSAPETFKAWAPQHDTMSRREKIEGAQKGSAALGAIEEWQTKAALGDKKADLDRLSADSRARMSAATSMYSTSSANQRSSAGLASTRSRELWEQADAERTALYADVDGADEAIVKATAGRLNSERAEYIQSTVQTTLAAQKARGAEVTPELKAQVLALAEQNYQQSILPQTLASMSEELVSGARPGRGVARVEAIAVATGTDLNKVVDAAGFGSSLEQDKLFRESEDVRLVTEGLEHESRWQRETKSTHGDNSAAEKAVADNAQARAHVGQFQQGGSGGGAPGQGTGPATEFGAPQALTGGAPGPGIEAPPVLTQNAPRSAPQAAGAAPQQAQQPQEFMGLPVKPAGTEAERTMQWMEMYEQYPEHAPLKMARDSLLQSPEFQKFKKVRNYTDDAFAFKEMKRELRQAQNSRVQNSARAKQLNIADGSAPGTGTRFKQRKPAPDIRSVVFGSDKDTGEG